MTQQPELTDGFGCSFYGRAEKVGNTWSYAVKNNDGTEMRYPLFPKLPMAAECSSSPR